MTRHCLPSSETLLEALRLPACVKVNPGLGWLACRWYQSALVPSNLMKSLKVSRSVTSMGSPWALIRMA